MIGAALLWAWFTVILFAFAVVTVYGDKRTRAQRRRDYIAGLTTEERRQLRECPPLYSKNRFK